MDKKAIVFDFNGTMFFDEDKHVLAWRKFAKDNFNKDIKDEDFALHIHGRNNQGILSFLTGTEVSKEDASLYGEQKEMIYQKICEEDKDTLHLVDGLPEFLDELKANDIEFAICTSSMKPNVDWYIRTFDLHRWFDDDHIIYDDGTLKRGKPDPEIFLRAIETLKRKSEDVVVFEDAFSGIKAAYAAKAKFIVAIEPEERTKQFETLPGVKYVIHDFKNLPLPLREEFGLKS